MGTAYVSFFSPLTSTSILEEVSEVGVAELGGFWGRGRFLYRRSGWFGSFENLDVSPRVGRTICEGEEDLPILKPGLLS